MLRSDGRILVTHAGSLPRPGALVELLVRQSRGEAVDAGALAEAVEAATRETVVRQQTAGIDVGNDGEQGRESFFTHVQHRMTGFGGTSTREAAARAVGDPRRVLAGTDCGFEVAAGLGEVAEEVVWEKLRALRAGADLATRRLFT